MLRRTSLTTLASTLVIAACSRESTGPVPVAPPLNASVPIALGFNASADGERHLVRFNSQISPEFFTELAALGGSVVFAHPGAQVAAVVGLDDAKAAELAKVSGVELVVADAFTTIDDPTAMAVDAAVEPQSPTNPTTAAFYSRQWHMHVVKANAAWAAGQLGNSTTKVGILDTGLDYLHPDLYGRVDLALSRSFLSQSENQRVIDTWGPSTHLVADLHYHGTHVGATVASNGLIAAGVTSQVTLVGLKVCVPGTPPAFQGLCPTSGTFQAILYAADNGIPVINMSLGGSFNRKTAGFIVPIARPELVLFEKVIEAVMTYANRRGTTVVVSAGNANTNMDAVNPDIYFSYCDAPYVICVGATGPAAASLVTSPAVPRGQYVLPPGGTFDGRASYSNFGSNVDVVAPGGSGGAFVWEACSGFTIVTPFLVCRNRSYNPVTGAFSGFVLGVTGTSMAAPHTSGLAALAISNPAVGLQNSAALIEQALERGADDIGAAGFDPVFGNGRINVQKTLAGLTSGKITN